MRHYSSVAAATTLTSPINDAQTTIAVADAVGYPVAYPFTLVIDPGLESEEIVTVTNAVGTNLTVVRGEDGSAAMSHGAGAGVRHMVTGRDLREPQQHINAVAGVHGVAGNLADFIAAMIPVGGVIPFLAEDPGPNWLLADGGTASRSEYPALFAEIGTTYGEGDGATTFGLPDFARRVPVGVDASVSAMDAVGKTGGSSTVTLTQSNLPPHSHSASTGSAGAHSHSGSTGSAGSHSHGVSHNASSIWHRHALSGAYALISRTDGGRMYFVDRNASARTVSNRVDGSYHGGSSSRSNFVAVEGATTDTRGISGSWNENASISTGSAGAHTHSVSTSSAGAHTHSVTVGSTGDGAPASIMQPWLATNWIIKAR